MGAEERFSNKGSRHAGRRSDVAKVLLAGVVIEMVEMSGSGSWDSRRRRMARASLSILSLSVMVSHLLSLSSTEAAVTSQNPTDSSELSIMNSINANAWTNKTGQDPCLDAWPGITCDGGTPSQHILGINLTGSGGIVAVDFFPQIGELAHLEILSLANCDLSGNLSDISGSPSFLSSLRSLDLSSNTFDGDIPSTFSEFSSLQSLSLAQNQLQGQVPEDLCRVTSLTVLMLEFNSLGGPIPECFGNLSRLTVLNISYNSLNGPIPDSLGQLKALTNLGLGINSLTGPLPASLTGLANLSKLHLSGNLLDGALPEDFQGMRNLQELYLDSNQFTGPIPVSICLVKSLRKLRLFDNQLTGSIPEDIGNLTGLTHLFLHANQLSGPLPMTLGNLTTLQELHLQGNRLNGSLEGSILTGFKSLRSLYLHFNELEGKIPPQILLLSSLTNVSLGFNKFNGSVPDPNEIPGSGTPTASKITMLSMCNNSLSGPLPSGVGALGNLQFLDFSHNELNGSIPTQLTSLISSNSVQANLIFNDFNQTSWITIPGGGDCLQLTNNTLNGECQAIGPSEGLAINAGGPAFKSSMGQDFVADESFTSLLGSYQNESNNNLDSTGAVVPPWVVSDQGVVQENLKSSIIASSAGPPASPMAADWTLFQTARVGADTLSYTIGGMKLGDYVVALFFAELDKSVVRSGQRVFSIYVQGQLRMASVDIFNLTGGTMRPIVLTFPLSLGLGVIDVRLQGRGSWPATQEQMEVYRGPIVSAINVRPFQKSKKSSVGVLAAAVGGGGALILAASFAVCVACVMLHKKSKCRGVVCTWNNVGLLPFKYAELEAATGKFSERNLLGQGAFGKVFKGVLPDGATVAIKQLNVPNPGSLECLQNELQVISTVRHRNLVPLIGCCLELDCPILVCQYMPNGNLHDALFKDSSPIFLPWSARRRVALDIARGLHYLHEESVHKIVHRDVKPANILLDHKLSAHITDFGMARLLAEQEVEVITGVMGTRGYMAPEYALNGQLSDRVDVFSFGVVLLELVIGRKGMQSALTTQQRVPLCHWAWEMFMAEKFEEMVDKRLGKLYDLGEVVTMLKVAIWCTEYYQSLRPSMSQVLDMLTRDAAIPTLPQQRKGYGEAIDVSRPFGSNSWEQNTSSSTDKGPNPSMGYSYSYSESLDYVDPDLELEAR